MIDGEEGSLSAYVQWTQVLPPNTQMATVANVAGTTLANDAYWKDKCKVIPDSTTLFIVVDMGGARDFYR